MVSKSAAHAAILTFLGLVVLLCGYLVFTERYILALISLLGFMASVKARIKLGHRGPRQALFAMHLACNAAFVTALLLSIFHFSYFWITPLLHVAFAGMVLTGAGLIAQSWHRED